MNKLNTTGIVNILREIIIDSKNRAVQNVNSILTLMYWEIGNNINQEILKDTRAKYGKEIVVTVSRELVQEFGRGFEEKNLRRMIQFATTFEKEKVVTLSRQLSWSHFLVILPLKDELQKDFYLQMCQTQKWSVRTFRDRVNSMLYERTALSKKPNELIAYEIEALSKGKSSQDALLKDPYLLDFYIDLLFYNRNLKKLVAIDLKIGEFKAAYKGQMELYLRWLDRYEKQDGEESPIGIILCTGKQEEQIELLELEKSGIHVAEYLTVLPPKKQLQAKLHEALQLAKERYHVED